MRQVKAYAELNTYNEITSFTESERVVSSYVITNTISSLAAQIIADLAAPRQQTQTLQLPSLQVITGQRGVGKSHLLAFLRTIIGVKTMRGLIGDSNIINAIGGFGNKPVTTIDINLVGFEHEPFEARLRQALRDNLKQAVYFDDEKWHAAVQGEQVFEQALGALPLGAQLILFIDNLPNRWRVAPAMAEADLDWLALIARQSASLPLRAVIVRDEEPGQNEQSDPGVYNLPFNNINEIIAKRVLKKTPQQMHELEELYQELLQQLPNFSWSKSDFVNCYPIHPAIHDCASVFRAAAPSFSLPSFSAAAASRVMSRPALSLITPDEVFDRYEYDFRKNPDLAPAFKLYDQIVSTAISKLPVSERLWAKLVLKSLFAFSLAGLTVTASQIANAQMLSVDGQPTAGYERVAKILDHFAQTCPQAFFIKGGGKSCSYVLASVNQTLGSNLETQIVKDSRDISPSDPRLHELLLAAGIRLYPDLVPILGGQSFPASLPQSISQIFKWRGSIHQADICFTGNGNSKNQWRMIISPLVCSENNAEELNFQLDNYTVIWQAGKVTNPSSLSPLKKLLVLSNIAAARISEGAALTEDFATIHDKLSEEVLQLFTELYVHQGALVDGQNNLPATPEDAAQLAKYGLPGTFSAFAGYAFDGLVSQHLPLHPQFEQEITDEQAQTLITEFFAGSEEKQKSPENLDLAKRFGVPLGLVTKVTEGEAAEQYQLDVFSESAQSYPYVQTVLGFIDHQTEESGIASVPLALLEQLLSNQPYGLNPACQQLVLGALTAINLIELFDEQSGQSLAQKDLAAGFKPEDFTSVRRSSSVSYPANVLAEWARHLTGNPDLPLPHTPDAERRIREAFAEWLNTWQEQKLNSRFEELPIEMLTITAWRALNTSKQRFARVSALAESAVQGKTDVSTVLSRIADVFGFERNALARTQEEMRALSGFLDWIPTFTNLRNYLLAAEPTSNKDIEQLRGQLSEQIQESRTLLDADLRHGVEVKFAEFLKRYSEFYAASHESNVGPSANRELITNFCASAEWMQFRLLMELKLESGAFERDAQALLKLAQETLCDLPAQELLQHQPHCCCSFRLHRRVHLGSLLEALKSIASAASTYYSLAIWRHRSELRTKVKDRNDEGLQFELEDFLAACGSGDLTDLTQELVAFINDCLGKEPVTASASGGISI